MMMNYSNIIFSIGFGNMFLLFNGNKINWDAAELETVPNGQGIDVGCCSKQTDQIVNVDYSWTLQTNMRSSSIII